MSHFIFAAFALAVGCCLLQSCQRAAIDPLPGFPRLMLWAWERPEDLRFLDPEKTGVAFLAETIQIQDGRATARPRLQPLQIAPGTKLMAVVRIEMSGAAPATDEVSGLVLRTVSLPGLSALQLDFDALFSQRGFYRQLVSEVRARLPSTMPLSMTALVSWCVSDNWINGLPVAEAVPMYFRMGPEPLLRSVQSRSALCGTSVGLSTDELIRVPLNGRVYLFHPRPWTPEALRTALAEIHRWS